MEADRRRRIVDSRDLANLCVQLLEDDRSGTFDVVGPALDPAFRRSRAGRPGLGQGRGSPCPSG